MHSVMETWEIIASELDHQKRIREERLQRMAYRFNIRQSMKNITTIEQRESKQISIDIGKTFKKSITKN